MIVKLTKRHVVHLSVGILFVPIACSDYQAEDQIEEIAPILSQVKLTPKTNSEESDNNDRFGHPRMEEGWIAFEEASENKVREAQMCKEEILKTLTMPIDATSVHLDFEGLRVPATPYSPALGWITGHTLSSEHPQYSFDLAFLQDTCETVFMHRKQGKIWIEISREGEEDSTFKWLFLVTDPLQTIELYSQRGTSVLARYETPHLQSAQLSINPSGASCTMETLDISSLDGEYKSIGTICDTSNMTIRSVKREELFFTYQFYDSMPDFMNPLSDDEKVHSLEDGKIFIRLAESAGYILGVESSIEEMSEDITDNFSTEHLHPIPSKVSE